MGFSLSWAAARGAAPEAIRDLLALRGTGTYENLPESEITGAALPGGWYLFVSQRDGLRLTDDAVMARVSALGEIVICYVEEHVMYSLATCWRDGRRVWSVSHDAQIGAEHLETQGEPPASYPAIRDRLRNEQVAAGGKQADVDSIFEIPLELAYSLTGYRHDQDFPGLSKNAFEVLTTTNSKPRQTTWWKKLIGR